MAADWVLMMVGTADTACSTYDHDFISIGRYARTSCEQTHCRNTKKNAGGGVHVCKVMESELIPVKRVCCMKE